MQTRTIKVRATKDFFCAGYLAIRKGDERTVDVDSSGSFCTTTKDKTFFGWCFLGKGWEEIPLD